ncbi:MAG: ABC transporter substrate-binding protein [Armatimonadetes bacterium]|nr:ABC transporter substrate-binding protein [Armatimonadota bacterium]
MRRGVMLLVLLTAALGVTGMSTAAPAKTEAVIVLTTDATTLDPARVTVTNDTLVSYYFFDYLLWRTADGKVQPYLAESYRAINDTTWEFKLRKNVKFHNGEPLNAEAVKFTFDRVLNPDNKIPGRGQIATIKEVKAVDEHTVHFITEKPDPVLATARVFRQPIIPPRYFKEKGEQEFARNPVGTGPYIFREWVKDTRIVGEANPNYWGGVPRLRKITFRPIPEYATRVSLLRTGEVDIVPFVVPDQAAALARERGIKVSTTPTLRTMFLIMRPDMAPLDKKAVRQALNYAVDKESIVKNLLGGYAVVSKAQVVAPIFFGFNPNMRPYPFDLERAKKLLVEAGYRDGFELSFYTPAGRYTLDKEIAEVIVAQFAKVGVRAKLTPMEWGVFAKAQLDFKFAQLNLFAFAGPYDAGEVYNSLFARGQPWGVGPYWTHPELERLLEVARTRVDPKVRTDAIHKAAAIIREEAPVLFMHHLVNIYAARDWVDFTPRPDDMILLYKK